jgi:Secretion system C-terminal sorting domain
MKTFFQFTFIFLICTKIISQACDPGTNGIESQYNLIGVGQTTIVTTQIVNYGGGPCLLPIGSVQAVISMPSNGIAFHSFVSPIHGAYFDWTYDAVDEVIIGINHSELPDGDGEEAKFRLVATPAPSLPVNRTIGIAIDAIGAGWPSNNPSNDNGAVVIMIQATPFPIELLDFRGYRKGEKHQLTWTTASELNSDYFELERSNDGKNWKKMGDRVKGAGNSNIVKNYESYDNTPLIGLNYYRLAQADLNGKITYSKAVILINDKGEISIYPNPASSQLTVLVPSELELGTDAMLSIRDITGKILLTKNLDVDLKKIQLDISSFANGNYIVNIINSQINFNQKMTIQH